MRGAIVSRLRSAQHVPVSSAPSLAADSFSSRNTLVCGFLQARPYKVLPNIQQPRLGALEQSWTLQRY